MVDQQLKTEIVTQGQLNTTFPVSGREDGQAYLSTVNTTSEHGLVLLQEWWGLNQAICSTADKFSEQGFRVLVPDIYRGKVAKNSENAGHLMTGLDWAGAAQDMAGAVAYLRSLGCKKIGVLGFCMGGALTVVALANIPDIDAASPYYGVPDLSKLNFQNVKCPVYAVFGENDQMKGFSSPDDGRRLEQTLKDAGVNVTLKIVQGCGHAFMNQFGPNFNEQAFKATLQENSQWFKQVFG